MEIERVILEYLASPRDKKDAAVDEMSRRPDEAFHALMTFRGPYPEGVHPIDAFPDYLSPLLTSLFLRCPSLLLGRDVSRMSSGERWVVISAAIASESPAFAGVILSGLKDRSIDVKLLAVNAVSRDAFLRTPDARRQLQRLLTLTSMTYCRDQIQRALDSFDDVTRGDA
jgi:hypothetical protein